MPGPWLGAVGVPVTWGRHAWRMAGIAEGLGGPAWWLASAAAGVCPLLLGHALGTSAHQPASAVLLFVLLLAAIRAERPLRGMGALMLGFGAHSAVAIALAASDPVGAAAVMPDGQGYWVAQQGWIRSGVDPEYDPANWVPHHLQLLVGIIALSYVSFGLAALFQGMYEVDLMNCYVGNLLARSDAPVVSLLLGWHPWSVLRGLCYVVLVYEIASWSFARFTGRSLETSAARWSRLGVGLALFAADVVVKFWLLEPVRAGLAAHLP